MAVFRVQKTRDYTVMSNYHLRDTELTLKAKGLLSLMLSLPEDWDYTLYGLSVICKDGLSSIRSAIGELEGAGYLTRRRIRNDNGQLADTEYTILEQPENRVDTPNPPICDFPILDKPTQGKPTLEKPTSENRTQLNTDISSTQKQNTELSNTHSILSPPPCERNGAEAASMNAFEIYREIIHENIEYPYLLDNNKYDHERINEIVDLMLETVCTARKTIRIASDDYPAELVKAKFLKLDCLHIEFILDCMKKNTTEIRNIKKYLLAVLFNAPSTMSNYYTGQVAHDMASGLLSGGGAK